MGTPRAKKNAGKAPVKSAQVTKTTSSTRRTAAPRKRPDRPDSVLHPMADKGLRMPVRPDTRVPVRPISVRHRVTVGEKTI